jgi:hypothetical protein
MAHQKTAKFEKKLNSTNHHLISNKPLSVLPMCRQESLKKTINSRKSTALGLSNTAPP